jgi:hypothetical protein
MEFASGDDEWVDHSSVTHGPIVKLSGGGRGARFVARAAEHKASPLRLLRFAPVEMTGFLRALAHGFFSAPIL